MTEDTTDLAVIEQHGMTLFGTDDPVAVIEAARRLAQPLAQLIETQKLYTRIGAGKHVRIEGWTLLGSMLGVFPVTVWTRQVEGGWEARVEARTRGGEIVGAAEAECLRSELNWKDRDDFALRSMAQTRAASKALRLPLGFVMTLGGFAATPAEEMDSVAPQLSGFFCPACADAGREVPAVDNRERHFNPPAGRKAPPAWKCAAGKDCAEGGVYGWGSWDPDLFESDQTGEGDKIERMYTAVTGKISGLASESVLRDIAEAAVLEAANELGIVWPDTSLDRDTLNLIYETAVGRL